MPRDRAPTGARAVVGRRRGGAGRRRAAGAVRAVGHARRAAGPSGRAGLASPSGRRRRGRSSVDRRRAVGAGRSPPTVAPGDRRVAAASATVTVDRLAGRAAPGRSAEQLARCRRRRRTGRRRRCATGRRSADRGEARRCTYSARNSLVAASNVDVLAGDRRCTRRRRVEPAARRSLNGVRSDGRRRRAARVAVGTGVGLGRRSPAVAVAACAAALAGEVGTCRTSGVTAALEQRRASGPRPGGRRSPARPRAGAASSERREDRPQAGLSGTVMQEPPLSTRAFGLGGRREVSWLPGLPLRAFPARVAVQWLGSARAVGFPGHSGGSAPDSHRLPCPPTLVGRDSIPCGR